MPTDAELDLRNDEYKVLSSSVYASKNSVCALILLNFYRSSVYFCILQERIEVYFETCDVWWQYCLNISIFVSFEIGGIQKLSANFDKSSPILLLLLLWTGLLSSAQNERFLSFQRGIYLNSDPFIYFSYLS